MNRKLKDYLQKFPQAKVDKTLLDELRREMREAVPEIVESIRKREELAAEFRIRTSRPAQSMEENED